MSQSERSGLDPKARKAELTALWQTSDSGAAFAAAAAEAGYQLAHGDRRAYVMVDKAGEVYALARQLTGVKTAEVKARLADLPPDSLPDIPQARGLQATRSQAKKDAPIPMDQPPDTGLTLEEQFRAELARLQGRQEEAQLAEAQRTEAIREVEAKKIEAIARDDQQKRKAIERADAEQAEARKKEALRQDDARKAAQIAEDDQKKRDEVARIAGLTRNAQAAELAKLEATKLEEMRQAQERAAAYLADQARRVEAERTRTESSRGREGAIRNASDRYMQALGRHYDVANPYGSLARAAMAEAGAFSRDQEELRQQAAGEDDPGKRELLDLRREIEAKEHFAQVGNRVSRINETLTAQPEQHWRKFATEQAAQAERLREQYRELAAAQDKVRAEVQRQEDQRQPGQSHVAPSPEQTTEQPPAEPERASPPPQDRQAQRDQEMREALAKDHAKQREALEQRQGSDAERKALEERQHKEQQRLEWLQAKREMERQQAKERGRDR